MSMSAALSQAFSFDRTRARFRSDRIEQHEEQPSSSRTVEERAISPPASPTITRRSIRRGLTNNTTATASLTLPDNNSSHNADESPTAILSASPETSAATSNTTTTGNSSGDIENGSPNIIPVFSAARTSTSLTLAELEEERELARRRSSLCILLASFVLFRLWVSAIQEGDFGLMLLCLVGTSWTARWISYNREREEELDRRIANYLEHNQENGADPTLERSELRMLSFQAQLALAIMESQRQMMQGGYGHPDGGEAQAPGVSDAARAKWTHMKFKASEAAAAAASKTSKTGYGSLSQKDKDSTHDDGPHCSICLCEYEEGDDIVKLPCGHLYHDECISSWTTNHVKCPLCNYDLESAVGTGDDSSTAEALASEIV